MFFITNAVESHYQIRLEVILKKILYPIQVFDLEFQIYYMTPERIKLFDQYENTPEHTNFYVILMKHKEIKVASEGIKTTGIELR